MDDFAAFFTLVTCMLFGKIFAKTNTGRKDAQGRTIWKGPRGGLFVVKNGKKTKVASLPTHKTLVKSASSPPTRSTKPALSALSRTVSAPANAKTWAKCSRPITAEDRKRVNFKSTKLIKTAVVSRSGEELVAFTTSPPKNCPKTLTFSRYSGPGQTGKIVTETKPTFGTRTACGRCVDKYDTNLLKRSVRDGCTVAYVDKRTKTAKRVVSLGAFLSQFSDQQDAFLQLTGGPADMGQYEIWLKGPGGKNYESYSQKFY